MKETKLRQILADMHYLSSEGDEETAVRGVVLDSREVRPGFVYVAIRGTKANGEDFIPQAVQNGAAVIVSENIPAGSATGAIRIKVDNARKAAAEIAASFYGHPSRHLKLVGVTGTNGKSSVVFFLYRLFRKLGYKAGAFSTIVNIINDEEMPASLTTPDAITLQRNMAEMVSRGCDYVFMEVSSHSLDQDRVASLDFDVAVFTNLTHDHLDYHKTFRAYLTAKKKLFDHLSPEAVAIVNADDKNGKVMVQNTKARVCTYALRSMADYRARVLDMEVDFMNVILADHEVITRVTGKFNAYNLLAVYAVADSLGMKQDELLRVISELEEVPGRFQRVRVQAGGPIGIVDYAHTPDAVEKLTASAFELVSGKGRLIIALGCGGDRDVTKRPKMARAAAHYADTVILTSDNPRMEEPDKIIEEMYEGMMPHEKAKSFKISDRREAIRMATALAQPGDLIVVAGKGHETYQEIKGERFPFDDYEELKIALTEKIAN